MTNKEVLNELYRKHTTWILMAEKLVPEYYSVTAEDIVQDVYLKIYDELRENKLKTTTIIKEGSPHYGIMYLRIRNIVVDMIFFHTICVIKITTAFCKTKISIKFFMT